MLFWLDATIGFNSLEFSAFEDAGTLEFSFSALEGELGFPVLVTFFTSDGSATEGMPNYLVNINTFKCVSTRKYLHGDKNICNMPVNSPK